MTKPTIIDRLYDAVYQLNQNNYVIEDWQRFHFEIKSDGWTLAFFFGNIMFWSTENFDHDWTDLSVEELKEFLVERLKERLYMIRDLF